MARWISGGLMSRLRIWSRYLIRHGLRSQAIKMRKHFSSCISYLTLSYTETLNIPHLKLYPQTLALICSICSFLLNFSAMSGMWLLATLSFFAWTFDWDDFGSHSSGLYPLPEIPLFLCFSWKIFPEQYTLLTQSIGQRQSFRVK